MSSLTFLDSTSIFKIKIQLLKKKLNGFDPQRISLVPSCGILLALQIKVYEIDVTLPQ